jgi:single-strand DNA-binding protein
MRGINRVILVGNLGRDPELKILTAGTPVAKMAVATTEIYRLKDGRTHTQTEWHNIVVWRGLATLAAEYLRKGSLVYIEGKIRHRQYENDEGQKHYITEIIADQLLMLDKKPAPESLAQNIREDSDEPPPF